MSFLLAALAILLASGLAALFRPARWEQSPVKASVSWMPAAGVLLAAALGLIPAVRVLLGAPALAFRHPWSVPGGEFFLELDALSAWFLMPILVLSAVTAIYGIEYLAPFAGKKSLGPTWLFFNLLVASMAVVVLAKNAVLFLVAWEIMALASFFLVTFEDERPEVREAGWIYLVATHLGTACVLAFFLLMGRETGTMDMTRWTVAGTAGPRVTGTLFLLAIVGFGTKAGFMPFHVWLPEAHPAAPSHVSALMSGVMIKTGIYGLLRALTCFGEPPLWWGWALIGIGLTSGILGVLFALAQHDLKRLLAYHSVENIGIIALGIGLGLIGVSAHLPALAVLGFGGGLLHVVNHALFKGLLFLGAGSVLHATGTRDIEHLGGLLKQIPWTAVTFLIGAVAIAGLPPLNGFISEALIFWGAFHGVTLGGTEAFATGLLVIAGLALIGGLAAACFAKAVGIVFLGEPRSPHRTPVHEPGAAMRWPMVLLAAGCVGIGLSAPAVLHGLGPALTQLTRLSAGEISATLGPTGQTLSQVVAVSLVLIALVIFLTLLRRWLLAGRPVTTAVTWDCGYAQPTARMQYTASSFAQPLTQLFRGLLRTRVRVDSPQGLFPKAASFGSDTPDPCHGNVYRPAFERLNWGLAKLRWLQHGKVQLYVLYIAVTLLVLLIWRLD